MKLTKDIIEKILDGYEETRIDYINASLRYLELNGYEIDEEGNVKGAVNFEDEMEAGKKYLRDQLSKFI